MKPVTYEKSSHIFMVYVENAAVKLMAFKNCERVGNAVTLKNITPEHDLTKLDGFLNAHYMSLVLACANA